MPLTLRWSERTRLPIEASEINPESLCSISREDLVRLCLPVGSGQVPIGDLFSVEGDGADGHLILEGNLRPLHGIATGMKTGKLTVRGDVGTRFARGLSGGLVELQGSAGDFAGAGMLGGELRIDHNAGDYLGAALPGARQGMRGGTIVVRGSVGKGCGQAMRRGLIAVLGDAGESLGSDLIAGTIFVFGRVARLAGVGMKRGSIVVFGSDSTVLLPSFAASGISRPPFVAIYLRQLARWGVDLPSGILSRSFDRYNGDLSGRGQGEILLSRS